MNKKELLERLDECVDRAVRILDESANESHDYWLGWVNGGKHARAIVEADLGEPEDVKMWIKENYDTFARAFLDDYEVKEEKKYCWRLKLNCGLYECYARTNKGGYYLTTDVDRASLLTEDRARGVLSADFDMFKKVEVQK